MSLSLIKGKKPDWMPVERSRVSDRWLKRYQWSVGKALKSMTADAVKTIEQGRALETRLDIWTEKLVLAQLPLAGMMAVHGYRLARRELAGKAIVTRRWSTPFGDVTASFPDEQDALLANRLRPDIESWTLLTSDGQSKTTLANMTSIIDIGREENWTVAQLTRELDARMAAYNRIQAQRVARTATVWNYNQGALMSYRDAGVRAKEWFVTDDDLLCDFCAGMQGVQAPIDQPFVGADTEIVREGADIDLWGGAHIPGSLPIPWDIEHPPLHPNCRCVLLAVI